MTKSLPLIGAHVSSAGDLSESIDRAVAIVANLMQIFAISPRQWQIKLPDTKTIKAFREGYATANLQACYLHASYLVNLATTDKVLLKKSLDNLTAHFELTNALGADGLIFHLGSSGTAPRQEGLERLVSSIKMILGSVKGQAKLVLENSAGGGNKLGTTIEEVGWLFKKIGSSRTAVCVDTAHSFEAGNIAAYTPANIKNWLDAWDKAVGLEHIPVMHINDSKTKYNSHHDQHANLGQGEIGLAGFKNLAAESRLRQKVFILEVPGFDNLGPDKKNVDLLKKCFQKV